MINVIGNITSVTGGDATSGTINYKKGKVEDANDAVSTGTINYGTINYKKGKVEDANDAVSTGTINYALGDVAPAGNPVATGTINYVLGSVASPGASTVLRRLETGTMISPARASGTAYNVSNMHAISSAYANGDVALKHNEKALVNEVGMNMPLYLLI